MKEQFDSDTLRHGEMLNWYRIEGILGRGGFGVTYLALDTNLDLQVAIKEYLPEQIAHRDANNSVQPVTAKELETFKWGLDRFITEARTLVKFKHQNIVRVMSVFESNDTAYMVMEFERGQDLKQLLESSANTTERFLKSVITPITYGLAEVHRHGFIHRDIKPANIYIRENKTPVLLDFGSARQALSSQTRQLTAMVSAGYAPLEQYNNTDQSQQGPWTDIYALGAVLYYAISGAPPLDSTLRASAILNDKPDPLKPVAQFAEQGFSSPFLSAIDWALGFKVIDRPQSLEEWRDHLLAEDTGNETFRSQPGVMSAREASSVPSLDELDRFEMPPHGGATTNGDTDDAWGSAYGNRGARNRKRRTAPLWRSKKIISLVLLIAAFGIFQLYTSRLGQDAPQVEIPPSPVAETERSDNVANSVEVTGEQERTTEPNEPQATTEQTPLSVVDNSQDSQNKIPKVIDISAQEIEPELEPEIASRPPNEVERERQEELNLLEQENRVDEVLIVSQLPKTNKPSVNLEPVQPPSAKSRDSGVDAITQNDIQEVTKNFNQLRIAIEKKNLEQIEQLVIPSTNKINFFKYAFSNFKRIDVSLTSISTQRSKQTIRARLEIEKMVRENGDRAMLADAYRSIVLTSQRTNGLWSKIYW